MKGSIILFLIVVLVLSYGMANQSSEEEVSDDSEDQDDDNCDDEDEVQNKSCSNDFVGTNLFGDDCDVNKCFSAKDIALLMARKDFENLIPKDLPKCLLDDHLVEVLMRYFYSANQVIVRMSNGNSKRITQLAFYDTLGGYLQHYLIPVAKYSFYAGIVKLQTTDNIVQLLNQCKLFLNTNGNGWMESITDFSEFDIGIEPIKILKNSDKGCDSACANLILADDESEDDEMIVPLPKLDPEEYGLLSNIWLPFKRKHHFNLRSHNSAFVLLRYYVLVTRCYQFQGVCQDTFNHKLKEWYQECIENHLSDDILYPGLGAVLRIIETLRNRKKNVFMPHQLKEDGSSMRERESRPCPFPKKQSAEYIRLNNKVGKLSDPSRQKALASLSRGPPAVGDVVSFDEDDSPSIKARRKKHITIAVLVLLFLLVFILAVAVLTKYMSNKSHKDKKHEKEEKKHEKEEKKKPDKDEKKKHDKEEKKHEKEEKKKHAKEEKKHEKEEKKHEKEEKKKHEKEEKKHEKEEKKHEKEEKKHEKGEKKKHEKEEKKKHEEEKKHEKEASSTDRHGAGSESSTSSSSSSRSSRTFRRSPRGFSKGGLKLSLVDEKGRSKKFSISKKNKPTSIVQLPTHSPRIRKRSNSMDSGGGSQLRKGALSTSWETID